MRNSVSPFRVILFLTLVLLVGSVQAYAERGDLSIDALTGTVQVKAAGAADWTLAQAGQMLAEGDSVKTGPSTTAILKMDKVGTLTLAAESELVINKKSVQGKIIDAELNVKLGTLKGDLAKLPEGSSFKLVTPTAVAAVRGTSFLITVNVAGVTMTYVYTGELSVQAIATGDVQPVPAGAALNVTTTGATAIDPASAEYANIVQAFQDVIAQAAGVAPEQVAVEQIEQVEAETPVSSQDLLSESSK